MEDLNSGRVRESRDFNGIEYEPLIEETLRDFFRK